MAIVTVEDDYTLPMEQTGDILEKLFDSKYINHTYRYSISWINPSTSTPVTVHCISVSRMLFEHNSVEGKLTIRPASMPLDYVTLSSSGVLQEWSSSSGATYSNVGSGNIQVRVSLFPGAYIYNFSMSSQTNVNFSVRNCISGSFRVVANINTANILNQEADASKNITLDISNENLEIGEHELNIKTYTLNSYISKDTFIYKFEKSITPIPTDSTLTQAVNHMVELGKEIDYQELKLSNNLVAKGVEVLPTDKMSNLIDKVGSIVLIGKSASGITNPRSDYTIQVTGLGFKPSTIIACKSSPYENSSKNGTVSIYNKDVTPDGTLYTSSNGFLSTGKTVITDDGFTISYNANASSVMVDWFAYE